MRPALDHLPRARRSLRMRLLLALTVGVVALELLWLAVAFVALRGSRVRAVINERPEELFLDWGSAWSGWPGHVRLHDVRIRGQDEQDQWAGEVDQADLVVRLWPLLRKEIIGTRTRLRGVVFRLRPRLDFVPPGSVDPAHLAPIPGYENPPRVAPAPTAPAAAPSGGRHWALRLPSIEVDDLKELWVNASRISGHGRLRGRLDYEIRGSFRAEVMELGWPATTLVLAGETLSRDLDLRLTGVLGPLRFSECKGAEYSRRLVAAAELSGEIAAGPFLARHLGQTDQLGLGGAGRLDATVQLAAGRLVPGSRLHLKSTALGVSVAQVNIRGTAELGVEVTAGKESGSAVSNLRVAVRDLGLEHRGDRAQVTGSGELELRAVAYDPVLPDGFRDVELALRLGPLELPDARVLNGFLPTSASLGAFRGGRFEIGAEYQRERGGDGRGSLHVRGTGLDFTLGQRECTGVLETSASFGLNREKRITVAPARIALTNVTMAGVKNRQADGWFATVDIDQGRIDLGPATNIAAEVRLDLLDIRPLLAVLRDDEESPGWLRFVPNLKNLRGGARVTIDAAATELRDVRLRGAATEVLAQLALKPDTTEGVLYARYGLLSALFDLRGEERSWTILGAKRAYRKRLAELHRDEAETPEGPETE